MIDGMISQYAIYDHPRDYPNHYVVRRWDIHPGVPVPIPNGNAELSETLSDARAAIPTGFVNIGRQAGDDLVILEVWI